MRLFRFACSAVAALMLSAALSGCGIVEGNPSVSTPMAQISGKVHGGQQPIVGAQVYLYAAGMTGYGTGAVSLLNSPGYTLTDANGFFSFNGLYSLTACQTAHQQVYVIAVGGDPGAGTNTGAVLMATLGDCANLTSSSLVWVNEVTTVASAYALQQFMTPGTVNVGTSATNLIGLQNAFLTVPNLVNLSTGNAMGSGPHSGPPQDKTNYLANILTACVNSSTGSIPCTNLFAAATPPSGTRPTDTLAAILDIALNPGNNVSTLYQLPPPAVAFPTTLAQPHDWTLGIAYNGGGLSSPRDLAIDGYGNIWVVNLTSTAISEFDPTGASLHGTTGLITPDSGHNGVSIDAYGQIWVSAAYAKDVTNIYPNGVVANTYIWDCLSNGLASDALGNTWGNDDQRTGCVAGFFPTDLTFGASIGRITFDGAGHFWGVPTTTGPPAAVEFNANGSLVAGEPATGWSDPLIYNGDKAAIDAQGDAWFANGFGGSSVLTEISPTGAILSGAGFPQCSNSVASDIAIDGSNTVWTTGTNGGICHFAHDGTFVSPSDGYTSTATTYLIHLAIDPSGNVWTMDYMQYLYEWVGMAAPVKTPAVQNIVHVPNTLGQRP